MKANAPIRKRKRRILKVQLARLKAGPVRLPPMKPEVADALARMGYHRDGLLKAFAPRKRVCLATTRRDTPCMALALANGRCRNHGGLSTGPKTDAGWERVRAGYAAWRLTQKRASPCAGVMGSED